ncbi:MAG: hypothetical protein V8S13_03645 [Gemmiger formicilis]
MKQKQPKFSGILVVAVLMVLVLFIVSLSPLLAASGSKDTTYSEIYYYFENQQVTSFRLDLGTGSSGVVAQGGQGCSAGVQRCSQPAHRRSADRRVQLGR